MLKLEEMSIGELTSLYNSKVEADKQIKKFSTKADGVRRLSKMLAEEAGVTVDQATEVAAEPVDQATEVAAEPVDQATEVAAEPVEPKAKRPRAPKGEKRIDKLVAKLKSGSFTVDELTKEFNTTIGVIRNDLCDIRKMLVDEVLTCEKQPGEGNGNKYSITPKTDA